MNQDWVVFSYSLPSKSGSGARVALWRRLQRLGAVSPTSGTFVLPARDDLVETFQWLAQEVQAEKGQAMVMHVNEFDGISEQELVELFREARQVDYREIEEEANRIAAQLEGEQKGKLQSELIERAAKLQRKHAEVMQIDYFDSPEGVAVGAQLTRISGQLTPISESEMNIKPVSMKAYQKRVWVTRPKPHVDRLACIWLIRRFVDEGAATRYAHEAQEGEVAFDMTDAEFGHRGNLCTFEVMAQAFELLKDSGMTTLGEIVHQIDLRDGRYSHAEAEGLDTILRGWLAQDLPDEELEARGLQLFDGLYEALSQRSS